MNKYWKWIGIWVILAIVLTGCNSAQPQDPQTDPVKITLNTNPPTPAGGNIELVLERKDPQGQPLTGATVDVSADHTDMSGMTMNGQATEQEDGKNAMTADFSRSGNWKVTVYVRKGALDFKKDFELKIP